ncbi:MAG: hypothetical protein U0002_01250 [Thermoanaerobaculia bacterium]
MDLVRLSPSNSRLRSIGFGWGLALLLALGGAAVARAADFNLTGCSYYWSAWATGWRTHSWEPWNCSNGLPAAGSALLGQAQNGAGTSGQTLCAIASGSHYNHPSFDGATTSTATCLAVPPAGSPQPSPALTVCSYTFPEYATGWRFRTWQAGDCSHGLPPAGAWSLGQAENGNGTEGMPTCTPTYGGQYNHPSWSGATSGTVRCAYVAPGAVANPEATLCQYSWSAYATGWRGRTWVASDCSHGLPAADSWAIGSSENGSGAGSIASCGATAGYHYNHPLQAGATTGTVRCLYLRRPPRPPGTGYAWDLTRDGVNDTNLSYEPCNDGSGRQCLVVDSWLFRQPRRIPVGGTDARPASTSPVTVAYEAPLRLIGDHNGDGLAEIALLYVRALGATSYAPALAVLDADSGTVLAQVTSPAGLTVTPDGYPISGDALFPGGPGGLVYPALTPGYGDSNANPAKQWGWGCLFRLGQSSSDCGPGFIRLDTRILGGQPYGLSTWFREARGHLQDVDGDGWEDLNLPYHWAFLTLSGQTGAQLTTTGYDAAAGTGAQPVGFHSGRNYGVHAAATVGAVKRIVVAAGSPVGNFDDPYCNVSRWSGVLEQPAGPTSRALSWVVYDGFHSNNWSSFPYVPPGGAAPTPTRWGDFSDKCLHRYGNARSVMDGQNVLLLDYFTVNWADPANASLVGRCKDQQYQLYMDPPWTQAKQDVWNACASQHLAARGRWGMKVLSEANGGGLTGSLDTYVWGWSTTLRSGGEVLYLVEPTPNPVRFDLKDASGQRLPPQALRVYALVNGLWSARGTFPAAGRPHLLDVPKVGGLGSGDFYPVRQLTLEDRDGDGLQEVLITLADGTDCWIGWSAATASWVVKP